MQEQRFTLTSGNVVVITPGILRVELTTGASRVFDLALLSQVKRDGSQVMALLGADRLDFPATSLVDAGQLEATLRSAGQSTAAPPVASRPQSDDRSITQQTTGAMGESIDFDNPSQLQRIQAGLIPGETLYAVYDMKGGGTGFIGITDRRLIVQDEGRIRKRRSLITIPYSRITMLASADEGGIVRRTSELTVWAGGQEFDFEFRSSDKAERAYTFIVRNMT